MLPIIFAVPIVQLLVLGFAATMEIKNIDVTIVDNDLSGMSRELTAKFEGSPFFNVTNFTTNYEEAVHDLYNDKSDLILNFPAGFEKKYLTEKSADLQIGINSINGMVAGVANGYVSAIVMEYNQDVMKRWLKISAGGSLMPIQVEEQYWYNPQLNYQNFMVPGILVILVTLIGLFLTGLNVVREKEVGTIEQINVTPIRKHQFILGKLIPFWIIGLLELTVGLIAAKLIYDIPIVGSLGVLYTVAAIYLITILGIGLFFSTLAQTQQQMMFITFFFMIIFILMSGLFTATETMPDWAQTFNRINPLYYFMRVIRMVILKGSGFSHIMPEMYALIIYAVLANAAAVIRYKKTV